MSWSLDVSAAILSSSPHADSKNKSYLDWRASRILDVSTADWWIWRTELSFRLWRDSPSKPWRWHWSFVICPRWVNLLDLTRLRSVSAWMEWTSSAMLCNQHTWQWANKVKSGKVKSKAQSTSKPELRDDDERNLELSCTWTSAGRGGADDRCRRRIRLEGPWTWVLNLRAPVRGRRTRNLNSPRINYKSCAARNYLGLSETDTLPSLQVWPETASSTTYWQNWSSNNAYNYNTYTV